MSEESLPLSSAMASSTSDITQVDFHDKMEKKRLGVVVAAVFIVGAMCGSGVLAVPQSIVDSGYIGFPLLLICGLISAYTGSLLGKCWTILRLRYPEYEVQRITDPYPTIAFRAAGKFAEYATRFCIDATLFGGATVFLLLIAGNISDLIKDVGNHEFSLCFVVLILFGVLAPLTWLGTPKDFWQAGVLGAASSIVAAILITIGLSLNVSDHEDPKHSEPTFESLFNAFGTILFSFGGASCFPTIQVDMAESHKFPKSVVMGVGTVLAVYLLVGATGFFVVGDDMQPNVLMVLPAGGISYTVNILITSHLLMAYMIVSNPINQEIEGFLKIPDKFCLKRIITRTCLAATVAFVGLSIPHFDVILSLIGGSTVALTNFIFPPLYYLLLARQEKPSDAHGPPPFHISDVEAKAPDENTPLTQCSPIQSQRTSQESEWDQIHIPFYIRVLLMEIILIGAVGGISSTYFSFAGLVNGDSGFTVPCYVDASVGL